MCLAAGGKNTHSNGCCLHFIGNTLISWRMYKIKSVCTSVFESEIICASETTKDVVWIVGLLKFMFADALCLLLFLMITNLVLILLVVVNFLDVLDIFVLELVISLKKLMNN